MLYLFLIAALLVASLLPAYGQRVFATVDPVAEKQELRFDVNTQPLLDEPIESDLNFSPNVVFALDSSKAFVSFPGSHKIAVFDPQSGKILALVDAGQNPALISLTPDGKKIAVVSLFLRDNLPQPGTTVGKNVGSISIIDVQTLTVKTLDLSKVFFSFANNIVFSGDSKTGFVASSGTDEIIRFNVDTATEITPRLKMRDATRPSAITMAGDFSFFAVVLVGSPVLDKRANPDSIQIVETSSFTVKKSIAPQVKSDEPVHDFLALNTFAISPDGKFGVIADREISNSGLVPVPALARDHALLIDIEKGEVVQTFFVGGKTGLSTGTPDGKSFLTISELELTFIDIATQESKTVSPFRSNFKPTTRPAFSKDGSLMFVAAPIDDLLVVFNLKTDELMRLVDVGKRIAPKEGDDETPSAAPLDVAVSPDGKIITALNFNANTINLIRDTQRFFIPRLVNTDEWFTGIALTNNSSQDAELIFTGMDNVAILFQDDLETKDVVEFVNPVKMKIEAGKQTAFAADGLFQAVPGKSFEGWLDADSDRFQITSFFMIGDKAVKRLDGALAAATTASQVVLPEVRITDGFLTEIVVLNPNISLTNITVALFNHEGKKLGEVSRSLLGGGVFTSLVRDPNPGDEVEQGLFAEDTFKDFVNGYITVSSKEGIIGFQRYFDVQRMSALNGIPVAGQNVAMLEKKLFLAQIAEFGGSQSFVNLVNTAAEKVTVNVTLKNNNGLVLAGPVALDLEAGHAVRKRVGELFGLAEGGSLVSGWMLLESDKPGIVGDAELQLFDGLAMTTIPAQGVLLDKFAFSHVAQGFGLSTGVALLNPGSDSAGVKVEVFSRDGELTASRLMSLGAGRREVKLLREWFPNLPDLLGGYIRVTSDIGILGLELFFSDNLELLSAVPLQAIGSGR